MLKILQAKLSYSKVLWENLSKKIKSFSIALDTDVCLEK